LSAGTRPAKVRTSNLVIPEHPAYACGRHCDERLPADRSELDIIDSRQLNTEPAKVSHVRRSEEALRIGIDEIGLDTVRGSAPNREPAVVVVVVQKHHEAFPVSDEEGGSPVAQAFRRLGQCQANCAHPGERLGDLWGREPAHNIIRAARASRAGVRLLRRRSKTKRRVCSLRSHCSLRSLRLALVSRCLPHSRADEKRVCPLVRPGQRRASLAQHGGRAIPDARSWTIRAARASRAGVDSVGD
jgi:hypothetical protein